MSFKVKVVRMARIMMIVYVKESLMKEDILEDYIYEDRIATGILVRLNIDQYRFILNSWKF